LQKEKEIIIPDDILQQYLSAEEINAYKNGKTRIESITVYADKPGKKDQLIENVTAENKDCKPGGGCC